MANAGETIHADRVAGDRIATATDTSPSSSFTTSETQVMSVTAGLVAGRTVDVWFIGAFAVNSSTNYIRVRIREDDAAGAVLDEFTVGPVAAAHGTQGFRTVAYAEFTAGSNGDQTFVLTGERVSGSATSCIRSGASDRPARMFVNYQSG